MRNAVNLRALEDEDFDSFNRLFEQVDLIHREAHPEYFRRPATPFRTKEHFEKDFGNSHILLLGAFNEKNELVGLAHAEIKEHPDTVLHVPGKFMLLDNIVVDQGHRGQGIGEMLYDKAAKWGKDNGASEVQLKVYSFNESAIAFYKKKGLLQFTVSMRQSLK